MDNKDLLPNTTIDNINGIQISDLLLSTLPPDQSMLSAFSPIQMSMLNQTQTIAAGQQHHSADSGNGSANSSAFSSPLNPSSSNTGQQNPIQQHPFHINTVRTFKNDLKKFQKFFS